jgi:hypothetical protein
MNKMLSSECYLYNLRNKDDNKERVVARIKHKNLVVGNINKDENEFYCIVYFTT